MFEISEEILQRMRNQIVGKLAGRPHQEIEDVVSDAYLKLVKALNNFKGECTIETYVYVLSSRAIADYLRVKYKNRKNIDKFIKYHMDKVTTPNDFEKELEKEQHIRTALDKLNVLTPRQRQAVRYVVFDGMTHAEAGKVLGISVRGVAVLMEYARKHFKPEQKNTAPKSVNMVEVRYWKKSGDHFRMTKKERVPEGELPWKKKQC